jgi:hypothetical protein
MKIYVHEIVDTVPGQEVTYMTALSANYYHPIIAGPGNAIETHQLWTWRTAEISGAFPKVLLLWEIPDWEQLGKNFAVQFTDHRDTMMEDWWVRNLPLRSGGYDRILMSAAFSPDHAALTRDGTQGRVFLHEIVRLPLDEIDTYLHKLDTNFRPAAGKHGWDLVGAYRVAMRPNEVIAIWAMREFEQLTAVLATEDTALREWANYRARVVRQLDELLLLPSRINPLHVPE